MLHVVVSPASDGGRGLKLVQARLVGLLVAVSPASDGGRGLKQLANRAVITDIESRPPAMAGVG